MDQQTANEKVHEYGFLLLLNSPEEIQFGIDNQYWKTGKLFQGVKLIPPGAHYVYYALKDEDYASRMGFFINIAKKKDVIVRRWDEDRQEFVRIPESDEVSYIASVRNMDFDKHLGAYPMDNYSQWVALSGYISPKVLDKLEPGNLTILSEQREREFRAQEEDKKEETLGVEDTIEKLQQEITEEERKLEKAQKREYKYHEAYKGINYTTIPTRLVMEGLSGKALTEVNFDKSLILTDLIQKELSGDQKMLLGELQFSFVTFLLGENLDSFEQWKQLICLMCTCESAITTTHKDLFIDLIPVLYEHLKQLPRDFFVSELSKVSFLNDSLKNLFEICESDKVSKKLKQRVNKLKQMLISEYDFKVATSIEERLLQQLNLDDDDMPVIVDENEAFISF